MTDKYPFELDTPIKETKEIPVNTVVVDKNGKIRIIQEKTSVEETVIYSKMKDYLHTCPKGEHNYQPFDISRYIVKCSKCGKGWQLRPQYQYVVNGHIYHRDDNHLID